METSVFLVALFRTTVFLSVAGIVCHLTLLRIGDRIPRLSRALWCCVLLSGWFWIQAAIPISREVEEPQVLKPQELTATEPIRVPETNFTQSSTDTRIAAHFNQERAEREIAFTAEEPVAETPIVTEIEESRFEWKEFLFPIIFAVWIAGMVVTIILASVGYLRFLLALRSTVAASDDFAEPWRRLLEQQGIAAQTIPMCVSESAASLGPALIRTIRGYRLVVPRELWSELTEPGRCGILRHELEHFLRLDVWKSFFVRVLALPHWFNPIAHLAVHRFEEAAEQLCDRAALESQHDGVLEFARTLLLLHDSAPTQFVARQSIFGRGLNHRVASLVHESHKKRVSLMKKTLLICGAVVLLAACLFRIEFVDKIVAQKPIEPVAETKPRYHSLEEDDKAKEESKKIETFYVVEMYLAEAEKNDKSEGIIEKLSEKLSGEQGKNFSHENIREIFKALEDEGNVEVQSRPQIRVIPDQLATAVYGTKEVSNYVHIVLKKTENPNVTLVDARVEKHTEKDGETSIFRMGSLVEVPNGKPYISSGELDGRPFVLCMTIRKVPNPDWDPGRPEKKEYIDQNIMRTNCSIRLKKLQAALFAYHKKNGHFPKPYTSDSEGKALLSWRVALLPFLGEEDLYNKIRKDEAWDGKNNRFFHAYCPDVFQCPFALDEFPEMKIKGQTTYALIVGKTAYPETEELVLGENFRDGTANTWAIAERKTPANWMDPHGDIPQVEAEKGIDRSENGIGLLHTIETMRHTPACFFDGSIHQIEQHLAMESLKALITPNGGEAVTIMYDDDEFAASPENSRVSNESGLLGRVVDERGNGMSGVSVEVVTWRNGEKEIHQSTKTGEDGFYRLPGKDMFSLGGDNVLFSAPGYAQQSHSVRLLKTEEMNVILKQGVKVQGRVIDDRTGKGAAGLEVRFVSMTRPGSTWPPLTAKTDTEGNYQTEMDLPQDRYVMFVLNQRDPEDETVGKIEGVEVTLAKAVFQAPDLHVDQCGWIEGKFVDRKTQEPVSLNSLNIDHMGISKNRFEVKISDPGPFMLLSGSSFKARAFPGENRLRILGHSNGAQIIGLDQNCTKPITVTSGETVPMRFETVNVTNAESLGKLPIPVEAEREAAEAVKRLGGWYEVDADNHVITVNMVYRALGNAWYRNSQTQTDEIMAFLPKFSRLKLLLISNAQVTDESAAHFAELRQLESLYCWNSDLSDTGTKFLGNLLKLKMIHISNAKLTDESLKVFSRLAEIRVLSLQNNRFTNRGLKYLRDAKTLEKLWWCLGETKVDDESLKILAEIPNLKDVELQGSVVTEKGFEFLAESPKLQRIYFSFHESVKRPELSRVTDALAKIKTLERFDTDAIPFDESEAKKLAQALPLLRQFGNWNETQLQRLRDE